MKISNMLSIFLCLLFYCAHLSFAADTMKANESIKDGDTLISSGGSFVMGFFSPGNSTKRYLGIWYGNISVQTVVWVANRQVPVTNNFGVLNLVSNSMQLLILSDNSLNTTIWSGYSLNSSSLVQNPVLQLLDSGNLVVRNENDDNPENYYWQSFDYPCDTLLPSMKIGKNFQTGDEWYLTSWKSIDDPAPGDYTYHLDPTGYPQLVMRKGAIEHFRFGSWNGIGFTGLSVPTKSDFAAVTYRMVIDAKEVYYVYDMLDKTVLTNLKLTWDGEAERLGWVYEKESWGIFLAAPSDNCDTYSLCGAYSSCNVICECLDKFVPRYENEWKINDWSKGCMRSEGLNCGKGDGFKKYSGLKLPDTKSSWYNTTMTLEECETECLKNCSCMGYATLDIGKGTGCLIWYGDLIDMKDLVGTTEEFYVRMAYSDSDLAASKHDSDRRKKKVIQVVVPLLVGMVLSGLCITVYVWRKRYRSQLIRRTLGDDLEKDDISREEGLLCFELPAILKATKNFSTDNKLGEGGFGPVYKGVLKEGQEIAVKRLSKTSNQGLDQFKNEVLCIAKLQHRNLVKLLGYCIQGEEMMLIYEYMSNKSLDSFIFDKSQSKLLDWPKRFDIINGIARGLLYLHQDSRLRIIHRDLKASNVLLDFDMNPKISDFGMARRFGGNETGANTRMVVGTYGYMSPEYAADGIFSVKSDVFSFGVMVLEIVSGKRNRGFFHHEHHHNLVGHAWTLYKEDNLLELLDQPLSSSCSVPEALRSIHVALLCVQQHPEDRPNMSGVVRMLSGEGELPQPNQPGFFTEIIKFGPESISSMQAQISTSSEITTLLNPR